MSAEKIFFDQVVGETIKKLRSEKKLSVRELSLASKVSHTAIANVEDGRGCTFHIAAQIAEGLDCTLDDLAPLDAMIGVS